MSKLLPPANSFGEYMLEDGRVLCQAKKGDIPVMTGLVWIDEPVKCPVTGKLSYLLVVQPKSGDVCTLRITHENFSAKYLKKTLGECGIIIHEDRLAAHYLSITAGYSNVLHKTPRTLIESPGWFANGHGFYTGQKAIVAPDVNTSEFRFEPVSRSPIAVKGALKDWQKNIGIHIQRNPVLLALASVFIASPFLRMLGMGSRLLNIYGPKGTAKTLGSQCAATVWGNGIDPAAGLYSKDEPYVTKFATTINGIEPLLARYSPFAIALDELTEQAIASLGELSYKISSGLGKHRMTSQMEAAPVNRWLLTIVSTSERSIADAATIGGKLLLGGQADRAIDIPIERVGIISNYGSFSDFSSITRHLKKACGENYGAAGQAILQYAVDHRDQVKNFVDTAEAIEQRLMPVNCGDGERRVVKFMSAAVVAGHIAIAAGVFDCTEEVVEAAVQLLVDEWWRGRGGCLRRVAEFVVENSANIVEEPPQLYSSAKAFIDKGNVIIPATVFEREFGEDADTLVNELWGLNALVREQKNRNKSRFCNNRLAAYVIRMDRLEPIMLELVDDEGRTHSSDGEMHLMNDDIT